MMLFTIVESFSPAHGKKWQNYCDWRGFSFERFDSIDGILRPTLFNTPRDEDWAHVVKENFMLHLISDYSYAKRKHSAIGKGELVGLRFDGHDVTHDLFLGFDIVDGFCNVSLLTNWGNDVPIINRSLASNALVRDASRIDEIQKELLKNYRDDPHVERCRIVSIYRPKENPGFSFRRSAQ